MSDTLAQLITKLQALLLGDSTTFSTDTCTAAIRQALLKLNLAIPQRAAETQSAVSEQYENELEDIKALTIVDVLDVVGSAGANADHLAVFDGATGKLIKDGGAVPAGGGDVV